MRNFILIILTITCISISAQDSLIIETLRSHIHLIKTESGQISGEGATLLDQALGEHQFVMIGEMHGIREVGDFSEAVFNLGKRHGFQYFALETDPWIAARLERLAKLPMDSLAAFEKNMPFSIPFYGNKSDFSFLQSIVNNDQVKGKKMWGLDQTFVVATRYLLHEIHELAKTDAGRQLAKMHFEKAQAAFGEAMGKGDPSGVYLMKLSNDDFKGLESAFRNEENFEALEIIHGIKKSQHIYQHWYKGEYYQNNRIRSQWMKNTFMRYYNEAMFRDGELPKVMFKFGSNHAVRGLTSVHIYDLGNMVSELAETKGGQSLHINFTAIRGTAYNMLMGNQDFDYVEEYDERIMEAIGDLADGEDWILIDVRPLRNIRMKHEDPAFKSKVFGFDFLVFAPKGTPLEPLK